MGDDQHAPAGPARSVWLWCHQVARKPHTPGDPSAGTRPDTEPPTVDENRGRSCVSARNVPRRPSGSETTLSPAHDAGPATPDDGQPSDSSASWSSAHHSASRSSRTSWRSRQASSSSLGSSAGWVTTPGCGRGRARSRAVPTRRRRTPLVSPSARPARQFPAACGASWGSLRSP